MRHLVLVSVALASLPVLTPLTIAAEDRVPVMVGGNGHLDACVSLGQVNSANSQGTVKVRHGPARNYKVIDTLKTGHFAWMCSVDGQWTGIVYPPSNDGVCDESSPINPAQPYKGRCRSGWIESSMISLIAG